MKRTDMFHLINVNMKIYDLTDIYPYRPRQKCWIPAAIAAAGSIASTLLSNKMSKDNAKEGYQMQKDYSQWLLRNQTQESVKDLRAAGLNPAFMNGSQLANTPDSPAYDTPDVKSPIDFGSAMMFAQVGAQTANLKADARKANADAEAQELLNADKLEKNKVLAHQYDDSVWMLDGEPISEEEANRLLMSSEPDKVLPNFVIRPYPSKGSEGRMQGEQMLKRWDKELSDISLSQVSNELNEMVAKGQIQNPEVIQALENMPYRVYSDLVAKTEVSVKEALKLSAETSNLTKQGAILDTEKLIKDLEYKIMNDTNIYGYIDKAFNGGLSWKDAVKAVVMSFVGIIQRITFGFRGSF